MVNSDEFQIENNQIQNSNLLNSQTEQTNEYIIQLLIYNIIYNKTNINQTITTQKKEFIEKEIVTLDIPTIKQINSRNNNNITNIDFYIRVNDLITNLKMKGYPITPKSKLYIRLKFFDDYIIIANHNDLIYISMLSSKNRIDLKIKNFFQKSIITDTFSILENHFLEEIEEKDRPKSKKLKIGDVVKLVYRSRMPSSA